MDENHLRTIIDVSSLEIMSAELFEQAVRQALSRGLVKRGDLTKAAGLNPSSLLAEIVLGRVSLRRRVTRHRISP